MSIRSVARRLLPATLKGRIHAFNAALNRRMMSIFAFSRFTSSLFYTFFSREFAREHQAVLKGRIAYWKSLKNIQRTCALLRRNTHRLEKGLIMRPRRASFAEAYIGETVSCFRQAAASGSLELNELKWAQDVLTSYFEVVTDTPIIARARADFEGLLQEPTQDAQQRRSIPYPHAELPQPDISPEQLKQLFVRRRSVRWYLDKPVPEALVREAINMASLAPSACNRQPYQFHFINESARAAKVAGYAGGTVGFNQNLQSLIVVVGDLNAYPTERDRHCIYIDGSLAAMQLMLALETMGLSTCPINWPDIEFREKLMEQELDLSAHQRPIMLMAVGYADPEGGIPFSAKKTDELLVKR
ncbi:nitroreductase-like protein [Pseudidiomarina aestuarii]|uniref:Nitroreductase-like protein n=1 Tax=Pseudidiomarina aestuarii TaxID=624146 RepID=A0A7Z6ZUJ0_9GAMM|nr:nitroreductase family protein [Pseudidiomarina aestuarii]RUO41644.1 nitroreductase-like protein [Pseudidiomarina aestuarii]